jgi:hypothetical protein
MIASLVSVKRLNKVDLPTLGRPTIATILPIVFSYFVQRYNKETKERIKNKNSTKK